MSKLALAGAAFAGMMFVEPVRIVLLEHFILTSLAVVAAIVFLYPKNEEWKGGSSSLLNHEDSLKKDKVNTVVDNYESHFGGDSRKGGLEHSEKLAKRQNLYEQMVNSFYDLVTDFYEYGWGESFHFAPRLRVESFFDSLRRHEYYLALRLGLNGKTLCADVGCGVGGPMRAIARFSGSKIVGINNNDYQVKVANKYCARDGLTDLCNAQKADFMKLPFGDKHFDHAYAIEATCHAPNKVGCYSEIYRVIKDGGLFACYEWVVTEKFNPESKLHRALKEGIEVGNGLPDLATIPHVVDSLKKAGFEVLDHFDMGYGSPHERKQYPWHAPLRGAYSLKEFRMTSFGRACTHLFVTVLEAIKIAPKGSVKVSKLLNDTANDLVAAGDLGIMTPAYFFLARKPN